MKFAAAVILTLLAMATAFAQATDTKIETIDNYKEWGWNSVVMQNGLITVATMPEIGAHIMQYDLGDHPSMYVNSAMIGKVTPPNQNGSWLNYGGYKVWPAPQSRWNWIPPVKMDVSPFTFEVVDQTADSVSLFVRSEAEVWNKPMLPGLVFERRTVVYKGSSRVKLEQSFVNTSANEMTWSIWDVTQSLVQHGTERDYDNFWAYFPIRTEGSVFGAKGVKTSASSPAWKGEVAPGVYGVQFKAEGKKIFADSPEGWIAYVDERDGYAYFKMFQVWEGADYPDDGACNEVWINNNPAYMEIEVLSPIWPIAPNGGKIHFTEDWYAAKMFGPVLDATPAGAIAKRLVYAENSTDLSGTFGVFYEGTAKVVFLDAAGTVVGEGQTYNVSPMQEFKVEENLAIPAGAATVQVRVYNAAGEVLGAIESKPVAELQTSVLDQTNPPVSFALAQNYPNPFNPATTLEYALDKAQQISLKIYDVNGREVETLVNEFVTPGAHKIVWQAEGYPAGLYVARLQGDNHIATTKMLLLK